MTDAGSRLHMKYPEQAHLLLGIAPVLLSDGKEEGRWCEPYDYTGKTVVRIAVWNKGEQDEIRRVKNLKHGDHKWVQNFWHANDLREEELVGKVKGVGRAKQQQLAKEGITKVGEIKHAMREKLQQISTNPSNSFTFTLLLKIQRNMQCTEPGDVPLMILVDHRKAKSRYGENWKESIKRGPKIKATICITE